MGLNCSEQGAQPLYSSSLWDIDPLAFSRLGWAAGVNFHIPWFHTCITNCGPEPNSPQALQTDTKLAGPGWAWGLCEGWMVREMSPWLRHTERDESWRPKGETELKNDQRLRYKHPVNSVFLF